MGSLPKVTEVPKKADDLADGEGHDADDDDDDDDDEEDGEN